jgi:hypothetical protein
MCREIERDKSEEHEKEIGVGLLSCGIHHLIPFLYKYEINFLKAPKLLNC